jgi:hypothetical protein
MGEGLEAVVGRGGHPAIVVYDAHEDTGDPVLEGGQRAHAAVISGFLARLGGDEEKKTGEETGEGEETEADAGADGKAYGRRGDEGAWSAPATSAAQPVKTLPRPAYEGDKEALIKSGNVDEARDLIARGINIDEQEEEQEKEQEGKKDDGAASHCRQQGQRQGQRQGHRQMRCRSVLARHSQARSVRGGKSGLHVWDQNELLMSMANVRSKESIIMFQSFFKRFIRNRRRFCAQSPCSPILALTLALFYLLDHLSGTGSASHRRQIRL